MADGVEIERKFLVERPPPDLDVHPYAEIEQGYLAITDDVEVRLRRYGNESVLTVKSSGGESRSRRRSISTAAGSARCGR